MWGEQGTFLLTYRIHRLFFFALSRLGSGRKLIKVIEQRIQKCANVEQ